MAVINFRVDDYYKKNLENLADEYDVSISTILKLCVRWIVEKDAIPDELLFKNGEVKYQPNKKEINTEIIKENVGEMHQTAEKHPNFMSLREINEEIRLARLEREKKK